MSFRICRKLDIITSVPAVGQKDRNITLAASNNMNVRKRSLLYMLRGQRNNESSKNLGSIWYICTVAVFKTASSGSRTTKQNDDRELS